jgi:hypothetical protein
MTPRLVPEQPEFTDTGAEQLVWETLAAQLPDEAYLIHGQRIQVQRETEIDLLVLWPDVGCAVVEVKGGQVWLKEGQWWQSGADGEHPLKSPVEQAQAAKHELIRYFRDRLSAAGGVGRIDHFVVLPYTTLPTGFETPDAPLGRIIDRGGLSDLVGLLSARLRAIDKYPPITAAAAEVTISYLRKTTRAIANQQNRAAELADASNILTAQQNRIVDLLRLQPRVEIVGGAGSGKTHLAELAARRFARNGKRVALLCYSRGLGRYFQQQAATWPASDQPAYVGLFHDLPEWLGMAVRPEAERTTNYYEHELPTQLREFLQGRDGPFDVAVVDEAQDFADVWWEALLACLVDPDESPLWVFTDSAQRIFDRDGVAPITLSPFPLDENLRNPAEIAATFSALTPWPQRIRLTGAEVRFVDVDFEDVVSRADDAVDALLAEGWEPGSIALLTTNHRHPVQVERIELGGYDAYWDEFFAAEDVFYGHVRNFKGLERPVVILAFDGLPDAGAGAQLYVGLSRATALLVVVGPREGIAAAGGPEVLAALDAGSSWCPPWA